MSGEPVVETAPTSAGGCPEAVVMGASAGAIEALSAVLPRLPEDYPLPVLIVVHVPRDRGSALANLFQTRCRMEVKEAEDKEPIRAGVVYFAPADYHLLVEPERCLSLSSDEPVQFSRPSIDVLFESAADVYAERLLGVIFTGANSDGAYGLRKICEAGGQALVQDPAAAQAVTMPEAALSTCPSARALSLAEISNRLLEIVR